MAFNFGVKVYPFNSDSKVVAYATLVVEDVLEVNGFKVINGSKGLFVSPPQKKGKDKQTGEDKWYDEVRFNEEVPEGSWRGPIAEEVYKAIIDAYEEKTASNSRGRSASAQTNTPTPTRARPSTEENPFGDEDAEW